MIPGFTHFPIRHNFFCIEEVIANRIPAANQHSTSTQISQRGSNVNLPNRVGSGSYDRGSFDQSFSQIPSEVREQFIELDATRNYGDNNVLAMCYYNFGLRLKKENIKFNARLGDTSYEFSAARCHQGACLLEPDNALYLRGMGDALGPGEETELKLDNYVKTLDDKKC